MKLIALAMGCVFAASAFGQDSECSTIKADKARLACFDKELLRKKAVEPKVADKKPEPVAKGPKQFVSHSWFVNESTDAMTDKKNCTALYRNQWTIQGTEDNLYISLKGRGGVSSYTIRIDDDPAKNMQLATRAEKDISAISLKPHFDTLYNASRLRVQVLTILNSIVVEDIDMTGFKEAIDYIRNGCSSKGLTQDA